MKSHARICIYLACMVAVSIPLGLYVNSRIYIVTALCSVWLAYHLIKLLSGERYEKEQTYEETFESFHGGPKDDTTRPPKESQEGPE